MSADDLIALLAAHAPPGLDSVALHPSGEAALQAAIASCERPGANRVVTLQHPATPIDGSLRALSPYCFRCPIGLTFPSCEIACLDSLDEILRERDGEIAAVVIEPAAQVPGGMITAPPGHLRRVRAACDAAGVALIADERWTGGGSSGFLWAVTRDAVTPDVLVAGSTLTGGASPFGATLSSREIPGAEPETAAAALAHLERVTTGNFLGEARRKASNMTDAVAALAGHPLIADVRVRGLIAGIELDESVDAAAVAALVPHASATGNVVIVAPPLDVADEDIDTIARAIVAALR